MSYKNLVIRVLLVMVGCILHFFYFATLIPPPPNTFWIFLGSLVLILSIPLIGKWRYDRSLKQKPCQTRRPAQ